MAKLKLSDKEKYLLEVFNAMLKSMPDITYGEFNRIFPSDDKKEELRKTELKYPELGLARYDTPSEGVSYVSLMATITDILCKKRLTVVVEKSHSNQTVEEAFNKKIIGFDFI